MAAHSVRTNTMAYDLPTLKLSEMTQLGSALRRIGAGACSMEEVARRAVHLLRDGFQDPGSSLRQCVLVRFYLTARYGSLDEDLRGFATRLMPGVELHPATRCLTLLATAGDLPEWSSPEASRGHRVIPLPSAEIVKAIPMVFQLLTQLELDVETVVESDRSLVLEHEQHSYGVFFVPRAAGSPYIPAQAEFVVPHGVESVLGFGGVLPFGEIYAMLVFTRVPVTREIADIFRNAAMNLKLALVPFLKEPAVDVA